MFAAGRYRSVSAGVSPGFFMVSECVLFLAGLAMTFKAYGPDRSE